MQRPQPCSVALYEQVDAAEMFAMASPEPTLADLDAAVFATRAAAAAPNAAAPNAAAPNAAPNTAPNAAPTATSPITAASTNAAATASTNAAASTATFEPPSVVAGAQPADHSLSFAEAIADAHRVAMRSDPRVVVRL